MNGFVKLTNVLELDWKKCGLYGTVFFGMFGVLVSERV